MVQSKPFNEASHALNELSHALALLESDNAKLRKIVDGWDFCSKTKRSTYDECVGCPLFEQSPHGYRCTRNECMEALAIEVR